jgi:hypothetical protein
MFRHQEISTVGSNCLKFQIELDISPEVDHELARWKSYGTIDEILPRLVLEVSLDISQITEKDTLFISNEQGRCDVLDFLQDCRSLRYHFRKPKTCFDEIMLERWEVEYIPTVLGPDQDFGIVLAKLYKQCIVHFRALYTIACLLPAWRLSNQISKDDCPLAIRYKIRAGDEGGEEERDLLSLPVFQDDFPASVTDQVIPDDIQAPLGTLSTKVTYRKNCSFFVTSNSKSEIRVPIDQGSQSLYGPLDDANLQRQGRGRSRSWPQEALRFNQSGGGQLTGLFLSPKIKDNILSTVVRPFEKIGFGTSRDAKGYLQKHLEMQPPLRNAQDGIPSTTNALSRALRRASGRLFDNDNSIDDPDLSGVDQIRGREPQPVPIETGRGPRQNPRRNSSAHSNASSGRGTSPASLRNISLAPREYDPSIPTLRHNYSAPDLQDWSNVQARNRRKNSDSSIRLSSSRSSSLSVDDDSISAFLKLLDSKGTLPSFTMDPSAQPGHVSLSKIFQRHHSPTADMSEAESDLQIGPQNESATPESGLSGPIPINKYSSSFTHRRGRLPMGDSSL